MHPDNLQSLSRARKEQREEDNKMKMFKNQLHHAFKSMTALERSWEQLDSHERATAEQVAQETGFDELGNFEEVVDKFKQFYLQMQRTTVIDGYQVWIDDNNQLCFKQASVIGRIKDLDGIKKAVNGWFIKPVPKETMIKIISWYIDNV
jgi:hypothetical protein